MPASILNTLDTTEPASTLESLPTEVLTLIIQSTSLISRISLALTSKTIAPYLVSVPGKQDYSVPSAGQTARHMTSEDIAPFTLENTRSDHYFLEAPIDISHWCRRCSICRNGGYALGTASRTDILGQNNAAEHFIKHDNGHPYMTRATVAIMREAVRLKTNMLVEKIERQLTRRLTARRESF